MTCPHQPITALEGTYPHSLCSALLCLCQLQGAAVCSPEEICSRDHLPILQLNIFYQQLPKKCLGSALQGLWVTSYARLLLP